MPSVAFGNFVANKSDIVDLWSCHKAVAGPLRGRKYNVEVLNKAVVVIVCAAWEAYCEDVIREAVAHIRVDCTDFRRLSKHVLTPIGLLIKEDKHEQSPWKLAGDGWKDVLRDQAETHVVSLNTPLSENIEVLFRRTLGIADITTNWKLTKCTVSQARRRLDEFVRLRCRIAHRVAVEGSVAKKHGQEFFELASTLANKVDITVNKHLKDVTGKDYW